MRWPLSGNVQSRPPSLFPIFSPEYCGPCEPSLIQWKKLIKLKFISTNWLSGNTPSAVIKTSKRVFYCENLIHSVPGRHFIEPFHKSLFMCAAALPIKDEADVDADTSQGHSPVWCICERSFVRASYSITDEKQADIGLTTTECIDVSLW